MVEIASEERFKGEAGKNLLAQIIERSVEKDGEGS
ncbi:hypothetical protein C8J48_3405 [Desmospora activa DSM 45169]|uniref:Uncharacterized protein n=1 Tax=Desmospora activa DSM 45169 TaxID=1121389 RepID=A0A2T4Z1X0_9BACL|nr:hypothetical protein C8J48_3405 [Desmospora activa DSM 45169]